MQVRCTQLDYSSLTSSQKGRVSKSSLDGWTTVGTDYEVFGIGQWETRLDYLIRSDGSKPLWAPAGLFVVVDDSVPEGWKFAVRDGISASGQDLWNKWVFMCGYPELIEDADHSNQLMEREPQALQTFAAQYVKTLDTTNEDSDQ